MKNWLRRKLLNILNNNTDEAKLEVPYTSCGNSVALSGSRTHGNAEIQFTVAVARGGLIVSVRTYDKLRDDYLYINHIIHDDQDAHKNIADIASIELMKL